MINKTDNITFKVNVRRTQLSLLFFSAPIGQTFKIKKTNSNYFTYITLQLVAIL